MAERYRVEFVKSARKEFSRLPKKIQEKVLEAISFLKQNPLSELLNIKKIKGEEDLYHVRLGDYRMVYAIKDEVLLIVIIKIGHRKDIYRHL